MYMSGSLEFAADTVSPSLRPWSDSLADGTCPVRGRLPGVAAGSNGVKPPPPPPPPVVCVGVGVGVGIGTGVGVGVGVGAILVTNVKLLLIVRLLPESLDNTLYVYEVAGDRPDMLIVWLVTRLGTTGVRQFVVLGHGPIGNSTWLSAGSLVVHDMSAVNELIFEALTPDITGAGSGVGVGTGVGVGVGPPDTNS